MAGLAERQRSDHTVNIGDLSVSEQQARYASSIKIHSKRLKSQTVHSGLNYGAFQSFITSKLGSAPAPPSKRNASEQTYLFVHTLRPSSGLTQAKEQEEQNQAATSSAIEYSLTKLSRSADLDPVSPLPILTPNSVQLLFMQGYATNKWVKALGSFYRIDPEYFRRHLSFLSTPDEHYDLPALPSAAGGIVCLKITDIFRRQVSLSEQSVQTKRKTEIHDVRKHQKKLGQKGLPGESIIRRFSIHDGTTFTVEYDISITVQKSKAANGGWTAIIWSDVGDPLDQCSEKFWLDSSHSFPPTYDQELSSVPIIMYRPNVALNPPDTANINVDLDGQAENLFQTANLLPENYGSALNLEAMRADALYALSDIFVCSATSEKQFLNSMEIRLNHQVYRANDVTDSSISNLKYSRELLDNHHQNYEEVLRFLRNQTSSKWPKVASDRDKENVVRAKHREIVEDFEYLLLRAKTLSTRCLEGISIITNDVMLQESRKGIDQNHQTKTLTLLAFYFLPLSLATGFFGMNFKELGQGNLSIWIGILAAIILVCCQYTAYRCRKFLFDKWRVLTEALR